MMLLPCSSVMSRPLFDRVEERADGLDLDAYLVARPQREVIRRDDAGARQQEAALRKRFVAEEKLDQRFRLAFELRERRCAPEDVFALAHDLHLDLRRDGRRR